MEKQYNIYKITNSENGKIYVGSTSNFKKRKNLHMSRLRRGKHTERLQSDFKEGVYEFEVITSCEKEEKDLLERFWISCYKSNDKNFGYNYETGGNKGKKLNKDTCEKIRKKTKSRNLSYGNHPGAKKVIRINDGKVFDSIKSAAESIGLTLGAVSSLCRGVNKSSLAKDGISYQFAYYEEGKDYVLKDVDLKTHNLPKKVLCIDTQEVFNSIHEASKKLGLAQSKISLVCNGKRNHTGGYKFKFLE